MAAQKHLSFEMFLHQFEKMIIDTLVDKNKQYCEEQGKRPGQFALINRKQMFKVAFAYYDKNVFE